MAPVTRTGRKNVTEPAHCDDRSVLSGGMCSLVMHFIEKDCELSEAELRRLTEHKYSATDSSFLAKHLAPWWEYLVSKCPLWVAPNAITLCGLLVNLVTTMVLASYSADAKQPAPRWAYVLSAVGLFLYQSLDAIDGKQARRTGTASPLGELFDHGCDSVTQTFISMQVCLTLRVGYWHGVIMWVVPFSAAVFYAAHWQTYVTGTLKFEKFDVTECQIVVMALCLFTAVAGPNVWLLSVLGVQLNVITVSVCSVVAVIQFYGYISTILDGGVGKNGTTVADTSVIFPVFPLAAFVLPMVMIYFKSTSGVFDDNIVLYVLFVGFVASKLCNRIIIAHMSRSPLYLWDSVYVAPMLMMLNQYVDNFVDELTMLYICTGAGLPPGYHHPKWTSYMKSGSWVRDGDGKAPWRFWC